MRGGYDCELPGLLSRTLAEGNWLVQAKLTIDNDDAAASNVSNHCGLARGTTVLDETRHTLGPGTPGTPPGQTEAIALTAVVSGAPAGATIALRCTERVGEDLQIEDAKITALQVETVTGP